MKNDLLQKRIIYLSGDITNKVAIRIGEQVIWLNTRSDEDITLYISSGGGEVKPGLDLYDIIKNSAAKVKGIVYGQACSMAAVVLQACTKRVAFEHAEIAIHGIKVCKELFELEDNWDNALEWPRKKQDEIFFIFAEATHQSLDEIKKLSKEKERMNAQEAVKLGFLDEVM